MKLTLNSVKFKRNKLTIQKIAPKKLFCLIIKIDLNLYNYKIPVIFDKQN